MRNKASISVVMSVCNGEIAQPMTTTIERFYDIDLASHFIGERKLKCPKIN